MKIYRIITEPRILLDEHGDILRDTEKTMKFLILLLVTIAINGTGCEYIDHSIMKAMDNKAKIHTSEYTLTLPSRFTWETTVEKGHSNTRFYFHDRQVGGVVHYNYDGADEIPSKMKDDIRKTLSSFFAAIQMEEYLDPQVDHMYSNSVADFELWLGNENQKFEEIHYFYIGSQNIIYDLWFNQNIFSDAESKSISKSFFLKNMS